ncbi:MAG: platelet-activating factor acetylhydrolase IB subunit [Verrucomicrobia bacterium]|nr:platelet-activating factor acetylhydrolase IB subunit [Verrucomicrobiota bacterium]
MKPFHLALTLAALCGVASIHAADKPAAQPPDVAAPKMDVKTGQPQEGFMKSHENFVKIAKEGKAKLVFLGDSITAGWNGGGKEVWPKAFGKYHPANFGIGGDRTQHVLWRITNGELDGIKPKAFVIMIGTNNSGGDPVESIAKGVTKIVETVRAKQPQAKVLLLAIFPRGVKPEGKLGPQNEKLKEVNAIICKLDDGKHVFYLDIGKKFVPGEGPIDKEIMPDFLHLTTKGYQIWADAIGPKLAELMK